MRAIGVVLFILGVAADAVAVGCASGVVRAKDKFAPIVFAIVHAMATLTGWAISCYALKRIFDERIFSYISAGVFAAFGIKYTLTALQKESSTKNKTEHGLISVLLQSIAASADVLTIGLTLGGTDIIGAIICAAIVMGTVFFAFILGQTLGAKIGNRIKFAHIIGAVCFFAISAQTLISIFV